MTLLSTTGQRSPRRWAAFGLLTAGCLTAFGARIAAAEPPPAPPVIPAPAPQPVRAVPDVRPAKDAPRPARAPQKPAKVHARKGAVALDNAPLASNPQAPVLLVLPPDAKAGIPSQIADAISDLEQSRIALAGHFQTLYFVRSLPTVRRAILDEALKPANAAQAPFDNDAKVAALLDVTGLRYALVTSVDDYSAEPTGGKTQTSLLISARIVRLAGGKLSVVARDSTNASSTWLAAEGNKNAEYEEAAKLAQQVTEQLMNTVAKATPDGADARVVVMPERGGRKPRVVKAPAKRAPTPPARKPSGAAQPTRP